MSTGDECLAALRAGDAVVLPFDTVYGLAADPAEEEATRGLYELKGRDAGQPSALVATDLRRLIELIPELSELATSLARLLPAAVTLILPNPAQRFRWLNGSNPDAIGVRVPELRGQTAAVVERFGAVVATSANKPGEPDPRRLDDVPEEIRRGAAAVVDGGELPGTPSTVIDLTGPDARILREGALPAAEALRRLGAAVRSG